MTPVVVLDNGASTIKTNVVTGEGRVPEPRIVTNAIVRQTTGDRTTYLGHEFDECSDHASLHYRLPFERGYLTDWDAQKAIWDGLFAKALNVNPHDSSLLITEPYFNLPNIQEQYDQFVFEEYEFQSYFRCTPAHLVPYGSLFAAEIGVARPECMLLVDSGYSFTHVIPLVNGKTQWKSVRRVDIGGKLLTNYLKELLSFREVDLMGLTHIANDVKEKSCFVSIDYGRDVESVRQDDVRIVQEYVLPNFAERRPGRIRLKGEAVDAGAQVVRMRTERFSVPELLFRPSDIGLMQCGVAGAVADSIASLPVDLQGLFWANVGVVGGNALFPEFRERLLVELRSLAPVEHEVRVFESDNPVTDVYNSGAELSRRTEFANVVVSRSEYQEYGSNVCRRKFGQAIWQASSKAEQEEEEVPKDAKDADKSKGKGKLGRTRSVKSGEKDEESSKRASRSSKVKITAGR